ncbi:hypothetical protein [Enhygromyxa salina]|uniref:Lipoprotein n=1 Tax=Enhygromyxa salina TaxID=215803 RepID=A0A2S9XTY6_9BACT|nr:hypothetical protein [Enhygromyxa salina]PRP96326.1 hypothetical protein ENSA7_71410 [Enhygromyxa salina]
MAALLHRAPGALLAPLFLMLVACGDTTGPQDDGPCEYQLQALETKDFTPWGVPVGEELAKLAGPYVGTWTWSPGTDEINIENANAVFEAEATFEVDQSSYRINRYVGGGAGVACAGDAVQADGMVSFADSDGMVFVSIPITVERTNDQPVYQVHAQLSPISVFSSDLTELVEVSGTSIRGLISWGLEGESLRATFEYTGQTTGPSGGQGFIVSVAEFE